MGNTLFPGTNSKHPSPNQELFQYEDKLIYLEDPSHHLFTSTKVLSYNTKSKTSSLISSFKTNPASVQHLSTGQLLVFHHDLPNHDDFCPANILTIIDHTSTSTTHTSKHTKNCRINSVTEFKNELPGKITLACKSNWDTRQMHTITRTLELSDSGIKTHIIQTHDNMIFISHLTLPNEIILFGVAKKEFTILTSHDGVNYVSNVYDHLLPLLKTTFSRFAYPNMHFKPMREVRLMKNTVVDGKNHFLAVCIQEHGLIVFNHDGTVYDMLSSDVSSDLVDPFKGTNHYKYITWNYNYRYTACCYDKFNDRIVTILQDYDPFIVVRIFCNEDGKWERSRSAVVRLNERDVEDVEGDVDDVEGDMEEDVNYCIYTRDNKLIIRVYNDVYIIDTHTMKVVDKIVNIKYFSHRDDHKEWYDKSLPYLLQNNTLKQLNKNLLEIILLYV